MEKANLSVYETASLSESYRSQLYELFDHCYRDADHSYFSHSISLFDFISIATNAEKLIGFSLGCHRMMEVPRLEGEQAVIFAGITCVNQQFRGQRLSFALQKKSCLQGLFSSPKRILKTGRMAHPVSYRVMAHDDSCVPRVDKPISDWHKEVGLLVSKFYGSDFDPETFVCRGKGVPIGRPLIDISPSDPSWRLFDDVNRDRGDSLLAMSWMPSAPENW